MFINVLWAWFLNAVPERPFGRDIDSSRLVTQQPYHAHSGTELAPLSGLGFGVSGLSFRVVLLVCSTASGLLRSTEPTLCKDGNLGFEGFQSLGF